MLKSQADVRRSYERLLWREIPLNADTPSFQLLKVVYQNVSVASATTPVSILYCKTLRVVPEVIPLPV